MAVSIIICLFSVCKHNFIDLLESYVPTMSMLHSETNCTSVPKLIELSTSQFLHDNYFASLSHCICDNKFVHSDHKLTLVLSVTVDFNATGVPKVMVSSANRSYNNFSIIAVAFIAVYNDKFSLYCHRQINSLISISILKY